MEIEYIEGRYQVRHEGRVMTIDECIVHLKTNSHLREPVGFVAPTFEMYRKMQKYTDEFDKCFDAKR